MSQRHEGHFSSTDQVELFYQTWSPERTRGLVLITHGLAEHSDCYHHVARQLADDGWKTYAWDLRGHGRSEGKRGYAPSVQSYVQDLNTFTNLVRTQNPDLNLILFGHSMGGLVTIRHLESNSPNAQAVVLSSPALGLSIEVPKIKEALAKMTAKWLPTLTLHNEVKYEDLTREPEFLNSYPRDTLRHDKISTTVFLSMMETFPLAMEQANLLQLPILMQLSGEDRLVSTPIAREFYERLPAKKKQLIVYSESLHEVYNDRERETVMSDLKKFINPYLAGA